MGYPEYIEHSQIVVVSGSMRFFLEMIKVAEWLTYEGKIVLLPFVSRHDSYEGKEKLWRLHQDKIDLAGEMYVIAIDDYIGASTKAEIEYARSRGKTINMIELPVVRGIGWGTGGERI
jgi:hypothetical protein